jgi:hypothetical protein
MLGFQKAKTNFKPKLKKYHLFPIAKNAIKRKQTYSP